LGKLNPSKKRGTPQTQGKKETPDKKGFAEGKNPLLGELKRESPPGKMGEENK